MRTLFPRSSKPRFAVASLLLGAACLAALFFCARAFAQADSPTLTIQDDCSTFAISPNNDVAYTVTHIKRFEKIPIQRDEVWISSPHGKTRRIVDPDKFMPTPPPTTYVVQSMSWSPDGQRLALMMVTKTYPWTPKVKGKKKGELDDDDIDNTYDDNNTPPPASSGGGNALALLDQDGREIKVAGSKTRFIEGAISGGWLADGKTVVYANGANELVRVTPDDGKSKTLFDEKRFIGVAFDLAHNRAIAVGQSITPGNRLALVSLDLLQETVTELARLDEFEGSLTMSPSGKAVGYFRDGDTIEVRYLANPSKPVVVHTGPGRFEFDRDDARILLKRGPKDKSNDLVWVRLDNGDFEPILHDLAYHDFHISPDGTSLGVIAVGRGVLRIYPLE